MPLSDVWHVLQNPYTLYYDGDTEIHHQWWFGSMIAANHRDQYGRLYKYYRSNRYRREWEAIIIEWDDGFPLAEALAKYRDWACYWYTTKSHQVAKDDKPACDRYRLIFPLSELVPDKILSGRAGASFLSSFAPEADSQSLINWHKAPLWTEQYRYGANVGALLSLDDVLGHILTEEFVSVAPQGTPTEVKRINNPAGHKMLRTKHYQSRLDEIPRHSTGSRYQAFLKLTYAMAHEVCNGEYLYADQEIAVMILNHTNDAKRQSLIASTLTKRSRGEM